MIAGESEDGTINTQGLPHPLVHSKALQEPEGVLDEALHNNMAVDVIAIPAARGGGGYPQLLMVRQIFLKQSFITTGGWLAFVGAGLGRPIALLNDICTTGNGYPGPSIHQDGFEEFVETPL